MAPDTGSAKTVAEVMRPNKRGVAYFSNLSDPALLSARDYFQSRSNNHSPAKPYTICKEWSNWIEAFKQCDDGEWRLAAEKAPKITIADQIRCPCQSMPHKTSSSITESTHGSSSLSSGTLTAGALGRVRSEFSTNFDTYVGASWVLRTGADVDKILFQHGMTLSVESLLHSFILDQASLAIGCFEGEDRVLFQGALDRADSQESLLLPEWKRHEISRYSLAPEQLHDLVGSGWKNIGQEDSYDDVDDVELRQFRKTLNLAMFELSSLYEKYDNKLPPFQSEPWYVTKVWAILFNLVATSSERLDFEPGDVCSSASSIRRNENRDLEERHMSGRKFDGLFRCEKSRVEIGAIEVGKADEGPTGSKVLKDARKLGKGLKDMFDLICNNCAQPIKNELRLHGLLISGLRVDFISLRYLEGRFYRLTREKTCSIPITFDGNGIRLIIRLVEEILLFKDRMELSAKLAYNATPPESDELPRTDGDIMPTSSHARTLSTPRNSPKPKRRRLSTT
ncbi:hypothetical protein EDD21DRAFT_442366 [Dissophora ornata]|nr:hypothetical protein EDD21DRAFT_442366 [Dissophora ornata]